MREWISDEIRHELVDFKKANKLSKNKLAATFGVTPNAIEALLNSKRKRMDKDTLAKVWSGLKSHKPAPAASSWKSSKTRKPATQTKEVPLVQPILPEMVITQVVCGREHAIARYTVASAVEPVYIQFMNGSSVELSMTPPDVPDADDKA
jgi:DNA-binding Xre family transcriptional regulator